MREPQRVEARARAGSAGKERPEGAEEAEAEEEEEEEPACFELALLPLLFLHDQKCTPPRPACAAATWLDPTRARECGVEVEGSAPE